MDPFARKMIVSTVAFSVFMVLLLAVLSVVYFHTHPRCNEELLSQTTSPDGRWTATVFRRRCGEEAPFFVHVNLRATGSQPRFGFFSGRSEEGQFFLAEQDAPEIVPQISWDSPTDLVIRCHDCRNAQKAFSWGPVRVH